MKKFTLFALAALLAVPAVKADETPGYVEPLIIEEMVAQRVSPNGLWIGGQDILGSVAYSYSLLIDRKYTFIEYVQGFGSSMANNGLLVGEYFHTEQQAAVMRPMGHGVPRPLRDMGISSFLGVSGDGSRAVGWINSFTGGLFYIPFYCDIASDGNVGEPQPIPCPTNVPGGRGGAQQCIAICASLDGKVVAGSITDGSGFREFPVVFIQGEDEEWSYVFPTASLSDNGSLSFAPNMALSNDGKTLFFVQYVYNGDVNTLPDNTIPYTYDIESGTLTKYNCKAETLIPYQVLADGTLVGATYMQSFFPFVTWILPPGETDFVEFTKYAEDHYPGILPWLEDNLGNYGVIGYDDEGKEIYGSYIISGNIYFSDDKSVIVGGVPFGDGYSYVFKAEDVVPGANPGNGDDTGSVETVASADSSLVDVYDICGVKVLSKADRSALSTLPRGIYIVNGKKLKL